MVSGHPRRTGRQGETGGPLQPYDHLVLKHRHTGSVLAQPAIARGETVYACLERHGLPIRTSCRGSTICGLCVVLVEEGLEDLPPTRPDEQQLLDRFGNTEPQARLACCLTMPKGRRRLVLALDPPASTVSR